MHIAFMLVFLVIHEVNSDDLTALHCKLVCLIQLGKFEEGLTLTRKSQEFARYFFLYKIYICSTKEQGI